LKRNTGFAVREYYNLGALIPSIAFGALLLPAVWRSSSRGGDQGGRFLRAVAFCAISAWTAYCVPNLFLFPFDFSVGMDSIFNTEFFFKAAGYSFGLLLSILTGAALYKAASGLKIRALIGVFALGVVTLISQDALAMIQILLGRNMIPRYSQLTRAVIWMISNENAFMYVLMALSTTIAITRFIEAASANTSGGNPAQIRKKKFLARVEKRLCASALLGVAISLLTVTVGVGYSNRTIELSPPVEAPASDGRILIPIEKVNDGNLYRFVHKVVEGDSTTDIRYIVIRKNETSFGVGLDACDVCGASGYYQRKEQVVCILCDVVMNTSTIGLPGGCNPVPLKYSVESGNIVIMTDDLAAEVRRFY
jgi:uncharacterized membrane protein